MFTIFQDLPTELRLKIWQEAACQYHEAISTCIIIGVGLRKNSDIMVDYSQYARRQANNPIMQVNVEARSQARKYPAPFFLLDYLGSEKRMRYNRSRMLINDTGVQNHHGNVVSEELPSFPSLERAIFNMSLCHLPDCSDPPVIPLEGCLTLISQVLGQDLRWLYLWDSKAWPLDNKQALMPIKTGSKGGSYYILDTFALEMCEGSVVVGQPSPHFRNKCDLFTEKQGEEIILDCRESRSIYRDLLVYCDLLETAAFLTTEVEGRLGKSFPWRPNDFNIREVFKIYRGSTGQPHRSAILEDIQASIVEDGSYVLPSAKFMMDLEKMFDAAPRLLPKLEGISLMVPYITASSDTVLSGTGSHSGISSN